MKKEENYKNHFYVALIIILILLLLLGIFLFRAYKNYSVFEQHRHYFSNPDKDLDIEPWMNINLITSNFELNKTEVVSYFNVSDNKINPEASLYRLCKQYKKNCTLIIEDLNKLK